MRWFILIAGVLSNAAASILIKKAGTDLIINDYISHPFKIFSNFPLIAGIVLYFFAFVFYILALKEFPLHVAHPILTSGSIAIVAIFAFLVLQEPASIYKVLGIIAILIGVVLLSNG